MTKRKEYVLTILIIVMGVSIYASTLTADFTYDDIQTILFNPTVREPFSLHSLLNRDFWGRSFEHTIGTWRPMTTLLLWMDWHVAGGHPLVFHVTNLFLYGLLLAVANAFLGRWGGNQWTIAGRLLAVAAFTMLVIHIDVITNATGRAEILAALFTLSALLVAMPKDGSLRLWRILASCLCLLFAMTSKESAFPMAIVIPWLVGRHLRRRRAFAWKPMIGLTAGCFLVLGSLVIFRMNRLPFAKTHDTIAFDNPLATMPWFLQKLGAAEVFTHYLQHTFTGLDLVPDYSYFAIAVLEQGAWPRVLLGSLALMTLLLVAILSRNTRPLVTDAIVGFAGSYAVASHLIVPASAMLADRLFFFPSFWLMTLFALWVHPRSLQNGVARRIKIKKILAGAYASWIVVQGCITTVAAATLWRNDRSLFAQALQSYVSRTRVNYALALRKQGEHEEAAWHILLSRAYLIRFPKPIEPNDFPISWDNLPLPTRLESLHSHLGNPSFLQVSDQAIVFCFVWRLHPQQEIITHWRAIAATSSSVPSTDDIPSSEPEP